MFDEINIIDAKVYILSIVGVVAANTTVLNEYLQVLLLIVTIGYTATKWINNLKNKK